MVSILVLEDDPAFKEIMHDFLTESGLSVTSVWNGVEGVHEVLAKDFDLILSDMMMPILPGDMFYFALERMRPHLTERFVVMTGHRGNTKVNAFVKSINAQILTKPFQVDDLLEVLNFILIKTGNFEVIAPPNQVPEPPKDCSIFDWKTRFSKFRE